MVIILFGPPGAGKGTQANLLAQHLALPRIVTGDLFREAIASDDALGKQVKPHLERGELVPDQLTIALVVERLQRADCVSGVVFDGFPRTVAQAQWFDRELKKRRRGVDSVVNLVVSDEEIFHRLAGRLICSGCQRTYHAIAMQPEKLGRCDHCGGELIQRTDDSSEAIPVRLRAYREQTEPVLTYYRAKGLVVDVDGEAQAEAVQQDILDSLPLALLSAAEG